MIRSVLLLVGLAVLGGSTMAAQSPDSATGRTRQPREVERMQAREEVLRAAIQQRFTRRVAAELELDAKQLQALRATTERFAPQRRALETRQRDLRQALRGQLRPGVAADQDSVDRIMKGLSALQIERAKLDQAQMEELSAFLTPVQRAKYAVMQQRLRQLVEEAASRRAGRRRSPPE